MARCPWQDPTGRMSPFTLYLYLYLYLGLMTWQNSIEISANNLVQPPSLSRQRTDPCPSSSSSCSSRSSTSGRRSATCRSSRGRHVERSAPGRSHSGFESSWFHHSGYISLSSGWRQNKPFVDWISGKWKIVWALVSPGFCSGIPTQARDHDPTLSSSSTL